MGGVATYRRRMPSVRRGVLRWRVTSTAVDVLLACFVAGLSLTEVLTGQVSGPPVAGVVIALLFGATMLTWRRAPFATLLACYALMVLSVVLHVSLYDFLGSVVAGVLVVASVAVHYRFWPAVAGLATAYVTLLLTALRDPGGWLWGAFIIGAAFAAGRLVRSRALLIADLRATTEELERSRDQQARTAVIEERTRIAREMHDVVAHAVSVMVVQAGAAQRMVEVDPERAAAAMEAVQVTGSTALVELRRMLGVLRLEPGQAELGPQPGLADLDTLVGTLERAGVTVSVDRRGRAGRLDPGVELTAYRILQEAVTNVVKHARASSVRIALDDDGDELDLQVRDDGVGASSGGGGAGGSGGGHGLLGMAERVAAYGGRLDTGPSPAGGFVVRARLPLAGIAASQDA